MTDEQAQRAYRALCDLQDALGMEGAGSWTLGKPKRVQQPGDAPVDMYAVRKNGVFAFTIGLNPDDGVTKIIIENLLIKGAALTAGACLTLDMYMAVEEIETCQRMRELEGPSTAYNDRNQSAWAVIRVLLTKIRPAFAPFVTKRPPTT